MTLAVSLHLLMTITEMVVMRCIYISKFSTIAAMNECKAVSPGEQGILITKYGILKGTNNYRNRSAATVPF